VHHDAVQEIRAGYLKPARRSLVKAYFLVNVPAEFLPESDQPAEVPHIQHFKYKSLG